MTALLEDEGKWRQILDILSCRDLHAARASLLYALQFVVQFLNSSFDAMKYEQLLGAQQSIPYLLQQVHEWLVTVVTADSVSGGSLPSQSELDSIFGGLEQQWKCLKLKMLAVKHIGSAQRNHAAQLAARRTIKAKQSGSSGPSVLGKSGIFGKLFGGDKRPEPDHDDGDEEKGAGVDAVGSADDPLMAQSALFSSFEAMTASHCLLHKETFCGILKLMLSTLNRCVFMLDVAMLHHGRCLCFF